jgi:creatinine amidohydrolase
MRRPAPAAAAIPDDLANRVKISMKQILVRAACGALIVSANVHAAPPAEDPRSMGGGRCQDSVYNCAATPNPLPATKTVWIDQMTWMDVRDALAAGKKTVIIPSGGIEPNGPWTVLGKHDYIARGLCDAVARRLGNALCAPVVEFVPEGEPGGAMAHMNTVGTIGVSDATYAALLSEIARGMKLHGFENIILIGDHGGGQKVMADVAVSLNKEWGTTSAFYINAFYNSWEGADSLLQKEWGLWKPGAKDGVHDDPDVELQLISLQELQAVRWKERVKAGTAVINGVSVVSLTKAREWGGKLIDYRAGVTVEAINKAIAARGR